MATHANRLKAIASSIGLILVFGIPVQSEATRTTPPLHFSHLSIPILGLTLNQSQRSTGVVSYVILHFRDRHDQEGLRVRFQKIPGRFSPSAQHAVKLAIERVAAVARLDTNSWTVGLTFPYPGITMYGESLSAMVGLSVIALVKGQLPIFGRAITGTITTDGRIGTVGGVPQKVYGAHQEHLDRVLIPEESHASDGDWSIPFLMHVSPVRTVENAYLALTGHQLFPSPN